MTTFRLTTCVATCVAAALVGTGASAADLPRRPYVSEPLVPAFSWTGPYVGANIGGVFGTSGDTKTIGTSGFVGLGGALRPSLLPTNDEGVIGGVQAGYNYQLGSAVVGLEADFDFTSLQKTARFTSSATVLGTTLTTSAKSQLDYLGTVRGRLGFSPFDSLLVYATGGLAYGGVKTSGSVVPNAVAGGLWSGSTSDVKAGYAVGAGLEYAFTPNISAKSEYLYYDLGTTTTRALGNGVIRGIGALNGVDYISRVRTSGSVVRAGVNYKF